MVMRINIVVLVSWIMISLIHFNRSKRGGGVSTEAHNCHGKTKNLTAKKNASQQNRKAHGKNKNLKAKPKSSRQKQNTSRQNRDVMFLFLPWGFWFCRDSCGPPWYGQMYFCFTGRWAGQLLGELGQFTLYWKLEWLASCLLRQWRIRTGEPALSLKWRAVFRGGSRIFLMEGGWYQ